MSQLQDARQMLEAAEHAAVAGDLPSADKLLRNAARIQEAELGPLDPDLAYTLNNLAIVTEKAGRLDDAEAFYRRAAAIASASLPPDHPMVVDSRQNLEDFCRARELSLDHPAVLVQSRQDTELGLDAFAREDGAGAPKAPSDVHAADAGLTMRAAAPASDMPLSAPRPPTPPRSQPLPVAPRKASRSLAWVAVGVAVLITGTLLVTQLGSSPETPIRAPKTDTTAPQTTTPPSPTPAEPPAPIERAQPPASAPPADDRDLVTDNPPAPAPSASGITLATAQLCQTLSTGGGNWNCDPIGDPQVTPGPVVLYTRVRSPRDAAVEHRWYHDDTLRRSVKLTIRASATEGYRTYSRQTVDNGDWRVEVMSADGDLLYEQRFAVR